MSDFQIPERKVVISVSVAVDGRRKFAFEKETEVEVSIFGRMMEEREWIEPAREAAMEGLCRSIRPEVFVRSKDFSDSPQLW
jgi:hypothetical protein